MKTDSTYESLMADLEKAKREASYSDKVCKILVRERRNQPMFYFGFVVYGLLAGYNLGSAWPNQPILHTILLSVACGFTITWVFTKD